MKTDKRLIAEFEEQSYTQIIFPHAKTDWVAYLHEAEVTFINIINTIKKYQKCLIVCDDSKEVKKHFKNSKNLLFVEYTTDDTWARDCSALSIEENKKIKQLDFTFNAWGDKFESSKDNLMTKNITPNPTTYDFVLEGGAIESNGVDTILTTASCMLNENRNPNLTQKEVTDKLKKFFGASNILYLNHGYLAGDDTDSHIDTLARFVDKRTIMYLKSENRADAHFSELHFMEVELQIIAKKYDFKLIALPMTDAIYYNNERLPATYANFLFINGAVLVPLYGVKQDAKALKIFQNFFHEKEVIGIDCSILIRQHGSLHCVTMNFPYLSNFQEQ